MKKNNVVSEKTFNFIFVMILFLLLLGMICDSSFTTEAYAIERENIYGLRYDYLLHYETGMIMGITITKWNDSVFKIKEDYGLYSIGIPCIFAGLKELRDYKANGDRFPDDAWKDFSVSILGALTGKLLCYTF